MKVLIVYASYFGSTRDIAERIAQTLRAEGFTVDVEPAKEAGEVIGACYDGYVVGSAIHGGRWLPAAVDYVARNTRCLARSSVWLFSSGPVGERYVHLAQPDPKEIPRIRTTINPRDHIVFAGAYDRASADFSRLGWMERNVASRLLPEGDFRDWEAIERWARFVGRDLRERMPTPL